MANEKKPSLYVDRGTIGSSDELDEYGVWVKSEPQDLDFTDFDDSLSTSDTDIDTGDLDFDTLENEDFPDFDTLEAEISSSYSSKSGDTALSDDDFNTDYLVEDFTIPDLNEDTDPDGSDDNDVLSMDYDEVSLDELVGPYQTESKTGTSSSSDLSTQLLMKIANELSSIRAELSNMKKEFTGTGTASSEVNEQENDSFFAAENDEKISLTGDEMNDILNIVDVSEESSPEAVSFDEDTFDVDTIDVDTLIEDDSSLESDVEMEQDLAELESIEFEDDITVNGSLELDTSELDITELDAAELEATDFETIDFEAADFKAADPETAELEVTEPEVTEPEVIEPEVIEPEVAEPEELESIDLSLDDSELDLAGFELADPLASVDTEESELEPIELDIEEPDFTDLESAESVESDEPEESADPFDYIDTELLADNELLADDELLADEDLPAELTSTDGSDLALIPEALELGESSESFDAVESFDSVEPFDSEELMDIDLADYSAGAEDAEPVLEEMDDSFIDSSSGLSPMETSSRDISPSLKKELTAVLSYMDQLLESLPDEKIEEFARSEYFDTYKNLFKELGIV